MQIGHSLGINNPKVRGQSTIPMAVKNILKKYNATILLPGASGNLVQTFQPGNYVESTGQTLAPVDQPCGLVLDAAGSVGSELLTNGGPFVNTTGWVVFNGGTLSVSGGSLAITNSAYSGATFNTSATVGKTYRVTIERSGGTATSYRGSILGNLTTLNSGTTSVVVVASTNQVTAFINSATAGETLLIAKYSVRELPGIHATQGTAGYKPVVRNTGGINSWQFDGTDDRLQLSQVPFQESDDFFVTAGFSNTRTSAATVFDISTGTGTPVVCRIEQDSNGVVHAYFRNDAGTLINLATSLAQGQQTIVSAAKRTGIRALRANGVFKQSSSSALGTTTVTKATLGSTAIDAVNNFVLGHIHGVIFGKGAITDSELLTLEKFVAKLQGRTL